MRRKPFFASNMPAAVRRKAILTCLQRFTFRQTCRMTLFIDPMMFLLASDRRSLDGRPSLIKVRIPSRPSRIKRDTSGASCAKRRARLRIRRSAFSATFSAQACLRARRTAAGCLGSQRSVMLRALWIWQRWMIGIPRFDGHFLTAVKSCSHATYQEPVPGGFPGSDSCSSSGW